jgi:hypothetical protein
MSDLLKWEQDQQLYLFTSLTAGSSHIVTATNRIETILKNARIPFTYIDTATNESAKALFQRRGRGKKLPFLVKEGFVLGELQDVEDWNEFGELKEAIGPVDSGETSVVAAPAKMVMGNNVGQTASATTAAAQPGAVPSPTKTVSTETRSSGSPPAPTPGATPLPPAAMSALQASALEAAALAKARQAGTSKPLSAKDSKEPAPTPVTATEAEALPAYPPPPEPASSIPAAIPTSTTAEATEPATPTKTAVVDPLSSTVTTPLSPTASVLSPAPSFTGRISPTPYVPDHFEPRPTTLRGSSVSLASNEEVEPDDEEDTAAEKAAASIKLAKDEAEADEVAEGVKKVKLDDTSVVAKIKDGA